MKSFKEYIALEEAKIDDYKAQESSTHDKGVINSIIKHPKTQESSLHAISMETDDPEVQKAIVKHPKADNNSLWYIAKNTNNPEIHKAIIKHPNVDFYSLSAIARRTENPEIQKALITHPQSTLGTINEIVDKHQTDDIIGKKPSKDILHHILNNHQGRLTHATLNGIKRGLRSKVPEIYSNSLVTQEHIDAVTNEGKVQKPEPKKKTPLNPFDLFSDDWFKE